MGRTLLAVSGTLQDGFELRGNLDHAEAPALFVGSGVVRGVRAFLDIKERGCREYRAPPSPARVNPANVVTGDARDINLYAVYLVDERVVLKALLGEPRYLSIAPDAVRINLEAPETSPALVALLRAAARELQPSDAPPPKEVSILTVLSTHLAPSFVPLPPAASTGSSLTSFPESLARFGSVPVTEVRTPGAVDAALRRAESKLDPSACASVRTVLASGASGNGVSLRVAALWDDTTIGRLASAAGFSDGRFGEALASLTSISPGAVGQSPGAVVVNSQTAGAVGRAAAAAVGAPSSTPKSGPMVLDAAGEQQMLRDAPLAVTGSVEAAAARAIAALDAAGTASAAHRAAATLLSSPAVGAANAAAQATIAAVQPALCRVVPAHAVLVSATGLGQKWLLHAGPPIPDGFAGMCGPMRGAVIGACIHEGWAADPSTAEQLARSGAVAFAPCHEHRVVGPMAGLVSPSMPLLATIDAAASAGAAPTAGATAAPSPSCTELAALPVGRVAFCSCNEGLGKVLRFGAHSPEVLTRLAWLRDDCGPALDAALKQGGPLELRPLLGAALAMGDDGHNRCKALTALLLQTLAPALMRLDASTLSRADAAAVLSFVAGNAHFGLNVAMGASKLTLDTISGIKHCTYATAIARNGVEVGVRAAGGHVSDGQPDWHVAPSPHVPSAVWFSGFSAADACRDLGDSAITETLGLGAPAMASAPALMSFVGGSAVDALKYTAEAGTIYVTRGLWPELVIPALDWAGVPMLLDVACVVATGRCPAINTGIAHKDPGVGQIGAGVSCAPLAPFESICLQLAATLPAPTTMSPSPSLTTPAGVPVPAVSLRPAKVPVRVKGARPSDFQCGRDGLALVMIDWQRDFLEVGGFGHTLGNDVHRLQAAVAPAARVLHAARAARIPIIHTLEAHDAQLLNCPPAKKRRCAAIGETLEPSRGRVLVRGEPGNEIISELAPLEGEVVIHKPGKGAFCDTELGEILERLGVSHLLFTGVTTEVCVQTSMREANDRGYDCLLVSDATESYFEQFKRATIEMVVAQGGIVGWAATADEVVEALGKTHTLD